MVVSFLGDASVPLAPVESNFLFLLLIQPDELLSRLRHKVTQALQVALPLSGTDLEVAVHKNQTSSFILE